MSTGGATLVLPSPSLPQDSTCIKLHPEEFHSLGPQGESSNALPASQSHCRGFGKRGKKTEREAGCQCCWQRSICGAARSYLAELAWWIPPPPPQLLLDYLSARMEIFDFFYCPLPPSRNKIAFQTPSHVGKGRVAFLFIF